MRGDLCRPRDSFACQRPGLPSGAWLCSSGQAGPAPWLDDVPVTGKICRSGLSRCTLAISTTRSGGGGCRYRPDLDVDQRAHLEPVLTALGLAATAELL